MMNFQPTIHVAIMGCVSAGKSTSLNMLMTNMFSDCHRKRTTTNPQIYRETTSISEKQKPFKDLSYIRTSNTKVNTEMKEQAKTGVSMRIEDITPLEYDVPKIKGFNNLISDDKGNDVTLTIHDLPGLNDALSKNTYFEYIRQNFKNYDVIIFVVDINSAMNSSDEVDILHLIISGIKSKKESGFDTKLIVLINKCDELKNSDNGKMIPVDEELFEMYTQCKDIIDSKVSGLIPHYVCISCENAFVYRMVEAGKFDDLDTKYINKIGQLEFPSRQWNKWDDKTKKEKIKNNFDNSVIEDGLKSSGFTDFSSVFNSIFSPDVQYQFLLDHIRNISNNINNHGGKLNIKDDLEYFNLIKMNLVYTNHLFGIKDHTFYEFDTKLFAFLSQHNRLFKGEFDIWFDEREEYEYYHFFGDNDDDDDDDDDADDDDDNNDDECKDYFIHDYYSPILKIISHKNMLKKYNSIIGDFDFTDINDKIRGLYIRCISNININRGFEYFNKLIKIAIDEKISATPELTKAIGNIHMSTLGLFDFIMKIPEDIGLNKEAKMDILISIIMKGYITNNFILELDYKIKKSMIVLIEKYSSKIKNTDRHWFIFSAIRNTIFTIDQILDFSPLPDPPEILKLFLDVKYSK